MTTNKRTSQEEPLISVRCSTCGSKEKDTEFTLTHKGWIGIDLNPRVSKSGKILHKFTWYCPQCSRTDRYPN